MAFNLNNHRDVVQTAIFESLAQKPIISKSLAISPNSITDGSGQITAFALSGANTTTSNNHIVYGNIYLTGVYYTIELYSDAARTILVSYGQSTLSAGTMFITYASNAITGTIDYSYTADDANWTLEIPYDGDRYIIPVGADSNWSGKDNQITEWNYEGWNFLIPTKGVIVEVEDESKPYIFNGTIWVPYVSSVESGFERELVSLRDDIILLQLKIDSLFARVNGFLYGFQVVDYLGNDITIGSGFEYIQGSTIYLKRGAYILNGYYVDFRYTISGGIKTEITTPIEINLTGAPYYVTAGTYYLQIDKFGNFHINSVEDNSLLSIYRFALYHNESGGVI